MAYDFVAASSQYLSTSSTPVTAAPVTIASRAFLPQTNTTCVLVAVNNNAAQSRVTLAANNVAQTTFGAIDNAGVGGAAAQGTYTTNTWYSFAGKTASAASRFAYLDGAVGSEDTSSVTLTGLNVIYIGARYSTSLGAFLNGQAAETAIWNVALTDAEIASLAKGFKPTRVRPQSLVFYAPLIRDLQDTRGGLAITNNNSATVADHPRVY
jgi:hypothetical protein